VKDEWKEGTERSPRLSRCFKPGSALLRNTGSMFLNLKGRRLPCPLPPAVSRSCSGQLFLPGASSTLSGYGFSPGLSHAQWKWELAIPFLFPAAF